MNPNHRSVVGGPAPAPSLDVQQAYAAQYAASHMPSQADQLAALRRSIWTTQAATPAQSAAPAATPATAAAPASSPMSSTTKMLIGIAVAAGILYFVSRK
jgi:hypothetical protein